MNILVTAAYNLSDNYKWYKACLDYSLPSFLKHVVDVDEVRVFSNEERYPLVPPAWKHTDDLIPDYGRMFKETYYKTKSLCNEGHNVLFIDVDALAVRPVNVFGRYNNLTMFRSVQTNRFEFIDYYYCGVRYFPATIKSSIWSIGDRLFSVSPYPYWDYEQYVYNVMLKSQYRLGLSTSGRDIPSLVASPGEKDAAIYHFNTSNNAEKAFNLLKEYSNKYA